MYNNFPWPRNISKNNIGRVEEAVFHVMEIRKEFASQSLADLYNDTLMPSKLRNAHKKLDLTVEICYRKKRFLTERDRIEYLFSLYMEYK
ncbi:type IIL restriction-modification enzyme MmeI [Clostridium psychrophilum]|uniref:type IIL restriction-modification enzyme MmeI n=1 Tax=Clostridium psychrophilum TaxID=132926 RepID=UPI0028AAA37C|nr:type IIL restriction-modification enzyme MmeI [Clostridium psychrophilum]